MPYTVDPVIPTFIAAVFVLIVAAVLVGLRHRNDPPRPPVPRRDRILAIAPLAVVAVSGLVLVETGHRMPSWWVWLTIGSALIGWGIEYTLRRRRRRDNALGGPHAD
jgi:hypothetical protein